MFILSTKTITLPCVGVHDGFSIGERRLSGAIKRRGLTAAKGRNMLHRTMDSLHWETLMAPSTFFWGDIMNMQTTHWTDMNRAFLEPLNRWNELASRNAEKMTQYGLALAKDLMEMGSSQLQLTNELKDPQKWMAAGTQLMTEYNQKMTDRSGEYLTLTTEIRESVWKWGEDTAKATTEAVQAKAN